MNSNETDETDELFDNFLKYEKYKIFDVDGNENDASSINDDDEFFDAHCDSACEKNGKQKSERFKSVSSSNFSIASSCVNDIFDMHDEEMENLLERFKKRESEILVTSNSEKACSDVHFMPNKTVTFDVNDEEFLNNEFALKSLMNKKIRDELMQIKELNSELNKSEDECDTTATTHDTDQTSSNIRFKNCDSSFLAEFNIQHDIDNSDLNKNTDKFKTWPADNKPSTSTALNNNNVKTLLNSFNETQNTATHIQPSKTNEKSRQTGNPSDTNNYPITMYAMCGTSQDADKLYNVASSIQSTDEFISPVDKQIAAIFRMTLSTAESSTVNNLNNSNSVINSNLVSGKKLNRRHTVYSNTSEDFFDNEEDLNDDDYDEEEDDIEEANSENSEKNEIKSLDLNNFKRGYKSSNLDNLSINDACSKGDIRSKTRDSIRRVFNKFGNAVKQMQNKAEEALNSEVSESDSDDIILNNETITKAIKFKAARSNKSSHEFANSSIIQILNSNQASNNNSTQSNPSNSSTPQSPNSFANDSNCIIWTMKFSSCGRLLATAGKDKLIRIWVLKSFVDSFKDLLRRNSSTSNPPDNDQEISTGNNFFKRNISVNTSIGLNEEQAPFHSKPFLVYSGHTSDILDVSWSKNLFLLSSSSDKTCRLWHIYKTECLCNFIHSSIVSAISFHPIDDRYFISACLDGKLRLWNIAEKKIVLWNDLNNLNKQKHNFITAISFCQGGRTIAVGTFDGKCILYHTEQLKYYSLINVRSTRGRNKRGSKITGIEVLNNDENKLLITSNDSRIRMYDLRDLSLVCKYKGFSNSTVHIKASLSHDDSFIISGSKNKCTYIWRTNYNFSMLNSGRRDRNALWERLQAHNAIVTCAMFHPKPHLILNQIYNHAPNSRTKQTEKKNYNGVHVFASAAGCDGLIKIFVNKLNL